MVFRLVGSRVTSIIIFMKRIILTGLVVWISLSGCRMRSEAEVQKEQSSSIEKETNEKDENFLLKPLKQNGNYTAVIEIPAGTNHKIEYHKTDHEFVCDQKDGKDRIIQFLGYPGNYGFIPSTLMDKDKGGDGDALDVLVLSENIPTGSYIEIIPVGIMYLMDGGEEDHKLLAVPADDSKNVLNANDLNEIDQAVQHIISDWFSNYKGAGKMEFKGFGNKEAAIAEIEKWQINQ